MANITRFDPISELAHFDLFADDMGYRLPSRVTVVCATKTMLVRMIQLCRVETPCFATSHGALCSKPCQWRKDCRKPFMEWLRSN